MEQRRRMVHEDKNRSLGVFGQLSLEPVEARRRNLPNRRSFAFGVEAKENAGFGFHRILDIFADRARRR